MPVESHVWWIKTYLPKKVFFKIQKFTLTSNNFSESGQMQVMFDQCSITYVSSNTNIDNSFKLNFLTIIVLLSKYIIYRVNWKSLIKQNQNRTNRDLNKLNDL